MPRRHAALALFLFLALLGRARAASLEAFAGVVAGPGDGSIPACTVFSPVPELAMFGSHALGMSANGGSACGYSGGYNQLSSATGTQMNHASLGPTLLGAPGFAGFFDGTADSRASYGSLGVQAHGAFSSGLPGSPVALFIAQSAAFFTDSFLASSVAIPNLSAGFVRYRFTVDGSLSAPGAPVPFFFGEAHATLMVQQQGGPIYQVFAADVTRGGGAPTINNNTTLPAGWTGGPGTLSGSGTFETLLIPIVWGQAFDVKVGMHVFAYGESDATFFNSATLSGIELFDANGNPVTGFSLTAASGKNYLPEPSLGALAGAGVAVLVAARRRTRVR
jgi:hypothetical protein